MNVVIIEDEAPTARQLERMLRQYDPNLHVLARLSSVADSITWFTQPPAAQPAPDIVFMDIHLDDGLAFHIFEQVPLHLPVIFTTAYEEYMIRAFKVNSVDYLLKPVDYTELAAALDKFNRVRGSVGLPDLQALLTMVTKPQPVVFKERFMVSLGTRLRSIEVRDTAYFFSEEKATFLVPKEGANLPIEYSLDQLADLLSPIDFFRVNRQFLVARSAMQAIHTYSAGKLKLDLTPTARHEVFVSLSRTTEFKDWLGR